MEFICSDPDAQVRAANVRATVEAFRLLPAVGTRLVERHGLPVDDLTPDRFIPVQRWLDALKEIQETVGPSKVREVGRNIISAADFPPIFNDAEEILLALNSIYEANHKGNVGRYVSTRLASGEIEVRCETPYPRTFERGLVEGICANKRANGRFFVQYTPGPEGGEVSCTLVVRRL